MKRNRHSSVTPAARQQAKRVRRGLAPRESRNAVRYERGWRHFLVAHLAHILVGFISVCILLVGFISVCILLVALIGSHLSAFANATHPTNATGATIKSATTKIFAAGRLLHFVDPTQGTALVIQTDPADAYAGIFTFTAEPATFNITHKQPVTKPALFIPGEVQYHGGIARDLLPIGNGFSLEFQGTVKTLLTLNDGTQQVGATTVTLAGVIDTVNNRARQVVLHDLSTNLQYLLNSSAQGSTDEMTPVTNYNAAIMNPSPALFNLTSVL